MDDFNSETDSDYTSYWRDWVSLNLSSDILSAPCAPVLEEGTRDGGGLKEGHVRCLLDCGGGRLG
jgi:hypothetical protein